MFAKIEKCFWEQNTIESCFKTKRKFHSNYELDYYGSTIENVGKKRKNMLGQKIIKKQVRV